MYPTVSDVLTLPVLRKGRPTLVAGGAGAGNRVRWVHIAEIADIAHLLQGGELVLTTGIALPDDGPSLTRYVDELAGVGAAGLVVELVRRWNDRLPTALTQAADRRSLPLVTLAEETRFVSVTEAVVALIRDAQLAELRAAEAVHETFTALTVSGAEPAEVLREVARTARLPVVLETLSHDVLAYDSAGTDPTALLAGWRDRSRGVAVPGRTGYDPASGWLVTVVGARGDDWGRLVLVCDEPPPHPRVVVVERAASALAVHRLLARDRETLERQTHRTLLTELLAPGALPADLTTRAAALGVPLEDRTLVGLAVRPRTAAGPVPALAAQEVLRDIADATALAARRAAVPALVGAVDDISVRALAAVDRPASDDAVAPVLRRLARGIHTAVAPNPRGVPVVVAVGTTVAAVVDARRTLAEAAHVAQAALRGDLELVYHRLADVRLRGLLHLLREDERLTSFAQRELGPLLARDDRAGRRLVDALRHYCEHGGNKSAAAAAAHLSRTAYYQQLARVEQVLGISLEDPESMLSLYVALLALDAGVRVR